MDGLDFHDLAMREKSALFKLGTLLQKERNEAKTTAVNAIVRSQLSTEEKVSSINKIDMLNDEEFEQSQHAPRVSRKHVFQAPTPEKSEIVHSDIPGMRNISSLRLAKRERLSFFVEPQAGGILAWLFWEQRRIRNFGEGSSTIRRNTFPFTLKPDPHAFEWFKNQIQGIIVHDILLLLSPLLRKAWLYLDKKSYNLLAICNDLCATLIKAPVKGVDVAAYRAMTSLWIGNFLFLQSQNPLRKKMEEAIEEAGSKLAVAMEIRKKGLDALRYLFNKDQGMCSLENICRATWMLTSHRFLELDQLVPVLGTVTNTPDDLFDCSLDVQNDIDEYFDKKTKDLRKVYDQYLLCRVYHYFLACKPKEPGTICLVKLFDFCGFSEKWDGADLPAHFLLQFNDRFMAMFRDFIFNRAFLRVGAVAEVFARGLIQAQLSRMDLLVERLGKLSTLTPQFSKAKYHKFCSDRREASASEAEMVDIIREYLNLLVQFGNNMAEIIRQRGTLAPSWTRSVTNSATENPIPHEGDILEDPPSLKGLKVHEAIAKAGGLAWYCAIHLGEQEPALQWQRMGSLLVEAQDLSTELKRLGTAAQYEPLLKSYNFVSVDLLEQ